MSRSDEAADNEDPLCCMEVAMGSAALIARMAMEELRALNRYATIEKIIGEGVKYTADVVKKRKCACWRSSNRFVQAHTPPDDSKEPLL